MNKVALKQVMAVSCIVAAVAALLAAPIANATKASNKQLCQNNLRVLWTALKAYQQDYMSFPAVDNGGVGPGYRTWCDCLLAYGATVQGCTCPAQDLQLEAIPRTMAAWGLHNVYPYGYAINTFIPDWGLRSHQDGTWPTNSDHVLLVADGYWSWFAYDDSENPKGIHGTNDVTVPSWWSNKVAWRHPRIDASSTKIEANFLTLSGHVVCLKKFVNTSQYMIGGINGPNVPLDVSRTSMGTAAKEAAKQ